MDTALALRGDNVAAVQASDYRDQDDETLFESRVALLLPRLSTRVVCERCGLGGGFWDVASHAGTEDDAYDQFSIQYDVLVDARWMAAAFRVLDAAGVKDGGPGTEEALNALGRRFEACVNKGWCMTGWASLVSLKFYELSSFSSWPS